MRIYLVADQDSIALQPTVSRLLVQLLGPLLELFSTLNDESDAT